MARLFILLVAASSVFAYLGMRLGTGLGWPIWVFIGLLLGAIVSYPLTFRRSHDGFMKSFRWFVHLDMGFLSFLFCLVVARDLIFFPFYWFKPEVALAAFGATSSLFVIALSVAALAVGVWKAASGPHIKRVRVPIAGLPSDLEGYSIAQISDLHVGPTIGRSYVEKVVRMVSSLKADLTVLTGDIADGNADEFRHVIEPLRELTRDTPALYVPGNHEYYWDGPAWIREFENLGIKALLNSKRILSRGAAEILVAGVVDPAARIAHPRLKPDPKAALGEGDDAPLKILLSHHPGIAREAADLGFDLQLSGHTHAGQFFPWTLVVSRVHEFAHGLKACGSMWVYVNPGTGSWGPPIRLGTTTEITLLELKRA